MDRQRLANYAVDIAVAKVIRRLLDYCSELATRLGWAIGGHGLRPLPASCCCSAARKVRYQTAYMALIFV